MRAAQRGAAVGAPGVLPARGPAQREADRETDKPHQDNGYGVDVGGHWWGLPSVKRIAGGWQSGFRAMTAGHPTAPDG